MFITRPLTDGYFFYHLQMRGNNKTQAKSYSATFYSTAGTQVDPLPCISLRAYCAKYFLSKSQVLRLLRQKQLCAVSFKKKLFIIDSPPIN